MLTRWVSVVECTLGVLGSLAILVSLVVGGVWAITLGIGAVVVGLLFAVRLVKTYPDGSVEQGDAQPGPVGAVLTTASGLLVCWVAFISVQSVVGIGA